MGIDSTAIAEKPIALRETERTDHNVRLLKAEVPWLPEDYCDTNLVKVRIGKTQFFLGSAIKGRALVDSANQLDTHRNKICDNLLNTHLPSHIEGSNPHIKRVKNARSKFPTFEIGNRGGQRVFFMRVADSLDKFPVLIRVAVCDKATERYVLSTITTDSIKTINRVARL